MRTITQEIRLFKFEEASPRLKEKIIEELTGDYCHFEFEISDAIHSLKELAKYLGVESDYSISPLGDRGDYIKLIGLIPEMLPDLKALSLKDCPLTGCFYDYDAINSAIEAIELESEYLEAFQQAIYKNCESMTAEEYISDMCEANGYEFTESGEIY